MMIDFDILWPKYGIKPDGVLHLGANTGQEAPVYQRHGVENVIWVEAIPDVYAKLLANVGDIPGTACVCACVGDEEGKEVDFHVSNNESQSSSYLDLQHHKVIHPEVHYVKSFKTKIRRLDGILKSINFDGKWFLNADLQGAELQAFKGMGDRLHDFQWVYSEVNKKETYQGGALIEELDAYLLSYGFYRAETGIWVGDTWTDALYCKK
jgi:FkbM family methyltransferase